MENQTQPQQPQPVVQSTLPVVHQSSKSQWIIIILILIILAVIGGVGGKYILDQQKLKSITDFESCAKAGYPVMESYPAQCRTSDGRTFVQKLSAEEQKKLILPSVAPQSTESAVLSNWKTYTNKDGGFLLQYPSDWSFEKYDQALYKGHTLFENKPVQSNGQGGNLGRNRVFGEIFISSTESLCGVECKNLSEVSFFDLQNSLWRLGNVGGGGPGTTVDKVHEIKIDAKRTMVKEHHPTDTYEGTGPNHRWIDYYTYLGLPNKEILRLSFVYDDSSAEKDSILAMFQQILSTFRFSR